MSNIGSQWRLDRPTEGFPEVADAPVQPLAVRTFLPDGYEPRYAYPLVVLFHPHGGNEEQAIRLVPKLSRRNFVAITLRGPILHGVREDGELACGWGDDDAHTDMITDCLVRTVEQTRRHIHVHSERIYLLGLCEGAAPAYRTAFALGQQIGGLAVLNGAMPKPNPGCPLFRYEDVRQMRVLIGHGIANAVIPHTSADRDHKLLYTAGADVRLNTYPTTHRIHEHMLRDVNRWLIGQINSETDKLLEVE